VLDDILPSFGQSSVMVWPRCWRALGRSQLDTGLCEVKARGEYRVSLPTPVTQPRLAHDWRGFFVKCAFTPAASFLRMP
jgi:hypothetical protein